MLRIATLHDNPRALTFRLEGRLKGPWVAELKKCWIAALVKDSRPALHVDPTNVTYIDAAGKECLAMMHEQGAQLIAGDCLIQAAVEEISSTCPLRERNR